MLARALGRIVLVPLAFVLGAAAALAVLISIGLEKATHALHGRDVDAATIRTLWDALAGVGSLASIATAVPAILVVLIGEVGRIRAPLYYVAGGGVAMSAMPLLARIGSDSGLAQIGLIWQVFATAGFVGGMVYWLIAGRRA